MNTNDGGPAFPGKTKLVPWTKVTDYKGPNDPAAYAVEEGGMSLLDYFAGQALAIVSVRSLFPETMAAMAYEVADAMLAERERR